MKALKLVHPRLTPTACGVEVDIGLQGTLLSILFRIRSDCPSSVDAALPLGESQWGLWERDVVELFVCCSGESSRLPYFEFQLSPLGQHFELQIFEPRKTINRDFRSAFTHSVRRLGPGSWEAEMSIPLDRLGWGGDPAAITGNAFAILGPAASRTYWSLFLEPQEKPDFHLPGLFQKLV